MHRGYVLINGGVVDTGKEHMTFVVEVQHISQVVALKFPDSATYESNINNILNNA